MGTRPSKRSWAPTVQRYIRSEVRRAAKFDELFSDSYGEIHPPINDDAAWEILSQIMNGCDGLKRREDHFFEFVANLYVREARAITLEKVDLILVHMARYSPPSSLRYIISGAARRGIIVPATSIKACASLLIEIRRDHKWAAELMLGTSHTPDVLSTKELCFWLHSSADGYDDNHGLFRLYGMLVRRMKYMPKSTQAYERCVQHLAFALYEVAKYGSYEWAMAMQNDWTMTLAKDLEKLGPVGSARVKAAADKLLTLHIESLLNVMDKALGPATCL